jgi:hypothetical protein
MVLNNVRKPPLLTLLAANYITRMLLPDAAPPQLRRPMNLLDAELAVVTKRKAHLMGLLLLLLVIFLLFGGGGYYGYRSGYYGGAHYGGGLGLILLIVILLLVFGAIPHTYY